MKQPVQEIGYQVSKFRMDEWIPSDSELEAAMRAYEEKPESADDFARRIAEAIINDVDGFVAQPERETRRP